MTNETTKPPATSQAHTPGPWRTQRCVDGDTVVFGQQGGEYVCSVNPDNAAAQANARLIAAAPDLLEALEELLVETLDVDLAQGIELTEREQDARDKALGVIAKATGHAA